MSEHKILRTSEFMPPPQGISTMRVWTPGVIADLLASGIPLQVAELIALEKGHLFRQFVNKNLVVDSGNELTAMLLSQGGSVGLTHHAIGTSNTPVAAGDTTLGTEVARKAFTINGYSGNVVSLSVYYLKSECAFNIQEVAVFGGPTASLTPDSGTLFSHLLQPYNNSLGTHDITFDHDLTVGG